VTAASSPNEAFPFFEGTAESIVQDADAIMGDETSHLKRRRENNDSERLAREEYESQRREQRAQEEQEEQEDNGDGNATGEDEIDPDL
jgi:hypothetical protein